MKIKVDMKEVQFEGGWIHPAQDRIH
jgi:hypothetical protein